MTTNNYTYKRTNRSKILVAGFMFLATSGFVNAQTNTIPESGNVGIGTTTPTARLQVSGSAKIDSSLIVSDSLHVANTLRVSSDASMDSDLKVSGNLILPNLEFPTTYSDALTFLLSDENGYTKKGSADGVTSILKSLIYGLPPELSHCVTGYTDAPTWLNGPYKIYEPCPDVKVGIGTASPAYNLDVAGNSKFGLHSWFSSTLSVGADNNNFARVYIKNPASSATLQLNQEGNANQYTKLIYMTFTEPTTEIFKVQNTTLNYTPLLLTAAGEMTINSSSGNIFNLQESGALMVSNAGQQIFNLEETGKFTLYSNGLQTFRVETNGLVRCRRMKVDLDTWADYVFEPTYRLMPLSEVEEYVTAEKHLPNIPSEKELIENGADVMEMNRLLMEKVEELTLYLIEQNKKDAQLQAEIETLKAAIADLQQNK